MGKLEAEPRVEIKPKVKIVPPDGCENFANCPHAQKLVSEQQENAKKLLPTVEPDEIHVHCELSSYDNSKRDINATLHNRLRYGGTRTKSPYTARARIDASDFCSNK